METKEENSDLLKQISHTSNKINVKNKKLKILIVLNQLIAVSGGGAQHIFEVATCWFPVNEITFLISKAGYEVARKNMDPCCGKRFVTYHTPLDHRTRPYIMKKIVHLSRLLKSILLSLKLRTQRYDVVIAPNFLPENIVPVSFFRGKAKLVVFFHGGPPSLRRKELKKRGELKRIISTLNWEFCVCFARLYNLIFVIDMSTRKYFIAKGFDPQKIIVVGNGIHIKKMLEINGNGEKYAGVFLGQLIPGKIRDIIEVWKEVVDKIPGARFCVIGDGPKRKELEAQAKKYGLDIIFKGWISGEEKYKILKSSKVFVFPSYYESWGIAIAEAMACGLPIIAYDQPVYSELFGNTIIRVKVGDVKEMAKKTIYVLTNYSEFEYMRKEGVQVVSKYSWDDIANIELFHISNIIQN